MNYQNQQGQAYGQSSLVGRAPRKRTHRVTAVLILVYVLAFIGFCFVAVSQATTSWTIKDFYKDFVYPDQYQGLWQLCLDKQEYECSPRASLTWLYVVRVFHLLSFLVYAVVLGVFIAGHINPNVKPTLAGGFLLLSSLLILIGMIVYSAKAPLPRTVDRGRNPYIAIEFRIRYGYSYMLGWVGMVITFIAGVCCLLPGARQL